MLIKPAERRTENHLCSSSQQTKTREKLNAFSIEIGRLKRNESLTISTDASQMVTLRFHNHLAFLMDFDSMTCPKAVPTIHSPVFNN